MSQEVKRLLIVSNLAVISADEFFSPSKETFNRLASSSHRTRDPWAPDLERPMKLSESRHPSRSAFVHSQTGSGQVTLVVTVVDVGVEEGAGELRHGAQVVVT